MSADDDELLRDAREARALLDPPPPSVRAAAERALTWDLELAELAEQTFDSLVGATDMRSDDVAHDLTFSSEGLVLELTVEPQPDQGALLHGMVIGSVGAVHLLQPGADEVAVDLDDHGRFHIAAGGHAAALRMTRQSGQPVRTPLFSLLD